MKQKITLVLICMSIFLLTGCAGQNAEVAKFEEKKRELQSMTNEERIKKCIVDNGLVSNKEEITNTTYTEITKIDCNDYYINNLDVILQMKNLQTLNLNSNEISDITGISQLTLLKEVMISANKIEDITEFKSMMNLTNLDLASNVIIDIEALTNLGQLEKLDLGWNKINDFSPLNTHPNINKYKGCSSKDQQTA